MASYYLINTTIVETKTLHAGSLIDDAHTDITKIAASGGKLWPATDAVVASAATRATALRYNGQSGSVLDDLMEASVFESMRSTASGAGAANIGIEDSGGAFTASTVEGALAEAKGVADGAATLAAAAIGLAPQRREVTLNYAAMSGLAGGVKTYILSDTEALPPNARVAGFSIDSMTGFDDASHGDFAIELGIAGANDVMASTSVKAGAAAAPKAGAAASLGYFGAPAIGTFSLKLTGSVDLNTLTAGEVTASLFYFVPYSPPV